MFDPLKGFLKNNDDDMTPTAKNHCNVYVGMMNLASLYHNTHMENTWREMDFKMHMYFKQEAGDNWKDKFNVKPSVLDTYESEPFELDSNNLPEWFVWV